MQQCQTRRTDGIGAQDYFWHKLKGVELGVVAVDVEQGRKIQRGRINYVTRFIDTRILRDELVRPVWTKPASGVLRQGVFQRADHRNGRLCNR